MGNFSGRNIAVESVAILLFEKCGLSGNLLTQAQESRSFLFVSNPDVRHVGEAEDKSSNFVRSSEYDDIAVDTQSETLRIQ